MGTLEKYFYTTFYTKIKNVPFVINLKTCFIQPKGTLMYQLDLTLPLTGEIFKTMESVAAAHGSITNIDIFGHIGTHLDLMGKTYPPEYFMLYGRVFDVQTIIGRDVEADDINLDCIKERDFVFFHSGRLASLSYPSKEYMSAPIQLSWDLLNKLIEKKVAMIGIDFAGVRRHKEHHKADMLCAKAGVFVVENVYALEKLVAKAGSDAFVVHCYPMRLVGATGLPCRIIAEDRSRRSKTASDATKYLRENLGKKSFSRRSYRK